MQRPIIALRVRSGVLGAAIAGVLGSGVGTQLHAQSGTDDEILVTGSRIVRRDFEANSPITTVDASRFEESSSISIESVVNQLPQFVPAISQFDAGTYTTGITRTPGAAQLSLRGLGANRNLVLLDGRRAMPVDAGMAVSINTIPSAAIARIETITGGASSVYGADAVAGVVNFITKRDFEGIDFDVQTGETLEGDGTELRISAIIGANFADDRGNVLLGAERSTRGEIFRYDRDFYLDGFADPTSETSGSFYSASAWDTQTNLASQTAINQIFADRPAGTIRPTSNFHMNNDGTLYTESSDGAYRYRNGYTDENGLPFRYVDSVLGTMEENQVNALAQIPLERYSLFGRGHMEIADNLSAFAQLLYSESSTRATGTDSPMLGGWRALIPHGSGVYAPSLNANGTTNANYLPGGRFGLNCAATGGCTKSQAFPTPPELDFLLNSRLNPEADWDFRQATRWAGPRRSAVDTTSHQIVVGVDGSFTNRDWTWELYGSTGSTRSLLTYGGLLSLARWRLVVGQPNYGRGLFYTGNPVGAGFSAGTITCTSGIPAVYGVSGYTEQFVPSEDCFNAVSATGKATGHMKQNIGEFTLQGGWRDLPAGEMRFAVGTTVRDNTYNHLPDTINTLESVLDLPAGVFPVGEASGTTKSKEVFGELLIPVLADKPGVQALNFELGYRKSFNEPSEDIDSYKFLVDWSVTDRVRIRGGRQIANRAPNIGELYQSSEQLAPFTFVQGDPCSDRNPARLEITANAALNPTWAAQVRSLCEQMMGPVGAATFYASPDRPNTLMSPRISNLVGNANLRAEAAETITLGVVTSIGDNTTLTVDYWQIEIQDLISGQIPDVIYDQCLNHNTNPTFSLQHASCQQIVRDPTTGLTSTMDTLFTNDPAIDLGGIDLQVDWGTDGFGPGRFGINFLATITDHTKVRVDPTAPWIDYKGTSGPSALRGVNPYSFDYRLLTSLNYTMGNWSASLRWRHLPGIDNEAAATTTANPFRATDSYDMFDGSARYMLRDRWELRVGMDNILDKEPEPTFPNFVDGRTALGDTNENFYDILGRRMYVGLKVQF